MATVNAPVPGSGPDSTLNLSDPATIIMILTWVGAALIKAVPAIAGLHIDQLYPTIALALSGLVTAAVIHAKHYLAGKLVLPAPPPAADGTPTPPATIPPPAPAG